MAASDTAGELAQALSFDPKGSGDAALTKGYRRETKPTLDIPVQAFSAWDSVQLVQSALTELENGNFLNASILVDATGRDDRISATFAARANGVLSLPLEFEPGIADNPKADAVAKEAEQIWPTMFPESEISRLIRWGRFVGVAPAEIVWATGDTPFGKRWTPTIQVWHPQFLQWDWSVRDYRIATMSQGLLPLNEPGRWMLYAPNGRYLAWQTGLIRALAIPFLIRWWAYRDWARFSEKHGLPIFKAVVPKGADQERKDEFFDSMAALGTENTLKCEQGGKDEGKFDAELLEPTADTWAGFKGLIEQCDASIAILMLGQNLTTEVKSGSLAAANVHERVRADFLRADAVTLSTTLRDQVLKPWAAFNFGDPELAPWPKWKTDPPEDRKAVADATLSAGQALNQLIEAKAPIDIREFCEKFGIPMVDEVTWAKMQADQEAKDAKANDAALKLAQAQKPAEAQPGTEGTPPAPGRKAPPVKKDAPDVPDDDDPTAKLSPDFIAAVGKLDITALDAATVTERAQIIAALAGRLDPRRAAAKSGKDDIPPSQITGQVFADDLADATVAGIAEAIKRDLEGVQEDVRASSSYDDLRAKLKKRLLHMDRRHLATVVERATILAHSAGEKSAGDAE